MPESEIPGYIPHFQNSRALSGTVTRINCVDPSELTGPHLIAEYRELPRVFALVRSAIERGEAPTDARNPSFYTLGKGHVRFFYPRLGYLAKRQAAIIDEMLARGYSPQFTNIDQLLDGFPDVWCNDWEPTEDAVAINRARISERLAKRP